MLKQPAALTLAALLAALSASCSRAPKPAPKPTGPASVDLTAIDTHVNPCQDFYQYACGNWDAKNPIPTDQSVWGTFEQLADRNQQDLHTILDQAAAYKGTTDAPMRETGDYYAACMDEAVINRGGFQPIQDELDNINSLTDKSQLAGEVARLQVEGVDALFNFGSDQDQKDANAEIAEADQGGIALPDRDYYLKTDAKSVSLRSAYVKHVASMLQLLGDKPPQAAAEAKTVLRIETALAQASQDDAARRQPANTYHKISVAQFTGLTPGFNWDDYFTGVGSPSFASLNVTDPGFYRTVAAELKSESLSDWKAYLRWQLVHTAAPALSQAFVDTNFEFFGSTLTGQQAQRPRWKRCVTSTDTHLGEALGQLYVRQYFPPDAKAQMDVLVHNLEAALGKDISGLSWMTDATKQQALVKLQAIANHIGYPDHWRDYSSIVLTRDNYYTDLRRTNAFEWHRQLNKIGKPIDRGEWLMTPPTVNAYYNPQWNEIVFPAGILQWPFYSVSRDTATNYGGIGVVMGHELTHGFDDEGRQYDPQGNVRDWWTPADAKAFQQRAACIVNEYAGFSPLPGVHLKGDLTLGENTADNGGARIAYMAMEQAITNLPHTNVDGYTPQQRFFLGFGQVFCENVRPEMARMLATVDPHSPGRFRVNGVVQNMPEFAAAFHCGPSDPLTASGKSCRVW